jgi:hypothetical protein
VQDDERQSSDNGTESAAHGLEIPEPSAAPESEASGGEQGPAAIEASEPEPAGPEEGSSGEPDPKAETGQRTKDFGERLLELQRRRDATNNLETRPPAGEVVTFRSVTVAEIYVGQNIDSLTKALGALEWSDSDEPITDSIAEARKGHQYLSGRIWLIAKEAPAGFMGTHARTDIPAGVDRIYLEYYVAGPSIVAVVLTFALDEDEGRKLDALLREDVESRLDRFGGGRVSVRTVEDIKKERIRGIRDDVTRRCLDWLKEQMPGSLSTTTEGLGAPTCALVTLAEGRPFENQAPYMNLLDLRLALIAQKFIAHDFLFLTHPISSRHDNEMLASFNEAAALSGTWLPELWAAPEVFHEAISSLTIADALYAVLLSFEPRLRDVRADLGKLGLDLATGSEIVQLRNRLLGISRKVSTVCGDVSVVLDDAVLIWRELRPLTWVQPVGTTAPADITADMKKGQLRTTMEGLQAQEAGLRDLILVTSQSMSETRNLELQTKVLDLTNKLNGLTKGLIVLTLVLVAVGVAALLMQVANTPTVKVNVNVTHSSRPSPPTPSRTPRPAPSSAAHGQINIRPGA